MVSHGSLAAESHQECDTEQDPVDYVWGLLGFLINECYFLGVVSGSDS